MSGSQITSLPLTISLNGTEQLEAVQNGTSSRTTVKQIADYVSSGTSISADKVSFVPSGTLTATNVQNALTELDTEKLPRIVVTFEELGALADGTDDGPRISNELYSRYGNVDDGEIGYFIDIHGSTGKTYSILTPIAVVQSRLRFFGNGATLDGANSCATPFTWYTGFSSVKLNSVSNFKITNFTSAGLSATTIPLLGMSNNEITYCGLGIDLVGCSDFSIEGNYINNCSGDGIIIESTNSGTFIESKNGFISHNRVRANLGYGIHLIDGGVHLVNNNFLELDRLGEIYVQASASNTFSFNHSRTDGALYPTFAKQDNTGSRAPVVGTNFSYGNRYVDNTIDGNPQFDFDIQDGTAAYIGENRLGAAKINIGASAANTLLMPNVGDQGLLTDASSTTIDNRFISTEKPIVVTFEDLGALADGTDDGARISAGLYARYGGLATSQSTVFVDVHATTHKTYTLSTPIVLRQSRIRLFGNGATLDGAIAGSHAVDFTQDNSPNPNISSTVSGFTIARFAAAAIRATAAAFAEIYDNEIHHCGEGIDVVASVGPVINHNYIHDNLGTAIVLESGTIFGGSIGETQRAVVCFNRVYNNSGYGIHLRDGIGHLIQGNDLEANALGEIYLQSSYGNQVSENYGESISGGSPFFVKQDNTGSRILPAGSRTAANNRYSGNFIGGGFVYDFDFVDGHFPFLISNTLGTGNIRIASTVAGSILLPQVGVQGTLTNASATTKDWRDLDAGLSGYLKRTGDTATGKLTLATTSASLIPLKIPTGGAAPTTTTEGDIWSIGNSIHIKLGGADQLFPMYQSSGGFNFVSQRMTFQSTTTGSQFALWHGSDPTSPINGDVWTTLADFKVRINGATSTMRGINTGDQTITLAGDVVGSGTSTVFTGISSNAVNNAKLAQMPANSIKGNNTSSTANAADLTISQVRSMLGMPAAQATFHWNGSVVAISSSFNVSSITRNGVGDYTIAFVNPLANAFYSILPIITGNATGQIAAASAGGSPTLKTITQFRITFLTIGVGLTVPTAVDPTATNSGGFVIIGG